MNKESIKSDRPKGEVAVWFSSLGLSLSLILIIGLVSMIFYNGILVFWPDQVVMLEFQKGKGQDVKGSNFIAGEITKQQSKIIKDLNVKLDGLAAQEWQLHVGNKDAYGFSYKFFDMQHLVKESYPQDIILAERNEYGSAIFFAKYLQLKNGDKLNKDDPKFETTLKELTQECKARRKDILQIEKFEIGKINSKIEDIRLEVRALQRKGSNPEIEAKIHSFDAEIKFLQKGYEDLAAKSRVLREKQNENTLHAEIVTGEPMILPVGNIYSFYYPNRLSTVDKISIFTKHFAEFFTEDPREANTEGGIFPAIFGTFVMTLLMSLAVTPFGVVAAIYLREYAKQGFLVRAVRVAVNNLAGVPSIVFGIFGLGFFVYLVGGTLDEIFFSLSLPTPTFGTGGIIWAALTLALMTVPVVIVATEEALSAVSRGMREGSLACGASKWQTIQNIILPASAPGILTGLILAMARGAGEVAPLMLVGVVKLAPELPIDGVAPFVHLERKFMHLGFHIYDLGFQSPDSEAAIPMVFATTFLLIMLVVALNLGAIIIRNRLRKKYQASTF